MIAAAARPSTRLLTQRDLRALLDIEGCIGAIEHAFCQHAAGLTSRPGVLATYVEGGGFHVKAAAVTGEPSRYAAKINANFPRNPGSNGLPTIQGVVVLCDARNGAPLAIMDSIEITRLRTAAATALAARHLARADARVLTMIGCGAQASSHIRAIGAVRDIKRLLLFDIQPGRAEALAQKAGTSLGIAAEAVVDYRRAAHESDIVVTCTPSHTPFLGFDDLAPGVFVAAVGADSEDKQELEARTLGRCVVVVDILEQCAAIGELHHALEAGVLTTADVRADLSAVVSGTRKGRLSADERIIFDSTGTALQDVAVASLAYERACARGSGTLIMLADEEDT
jgi:ornithine cyclodeaminase/alanine dehydrogenase-like protein (mu-crystallin family)